MSKNAKTSATKSKQRKQPAKKPQVDSAIREYLSTVVPTHWEARYLYGHVNDHIVEGIASIPEGSESQACARRLFHMVLIAECRMSDALEEMCIKFEKGEIDDAWLLQQAISVYENRDIYSIEDYELDDRQSGVFKLEDSGPTEWDDRARGASRASIEVDEGAK